ncbi:MAG: hypothetical protein B7Y39_19065 [Bdellovibrio sp. 28-41-41]|nr:MAG: hypothetical protein B7Y39_19065 [Bdellovibrio sp. 28-41-41]
MHSDKIFATPYDGRAIFVFRALESRDLSNRVYSKTTNEVELLDTNSAGFFIELKIEILKKSIIGSTQC